MNLDQLHKQFIEDNKITLPGKTFLFGEYAILVGGSGVGLATWPAFEVQLQHHQNSEKNKPHENIKNLEEDFFQLHEKSAAGRFLSEYIKKNKLLDQDYLNQIKIKITNGFTVGGFGQSTVEFISLYLYLNKQNLFQHNLQEKQNKYQEQSLSQQEVLQVFNDYLNLYKNDPQKPSGADVLTQILGSIAVFDLSYTEKPQFLTLKKWPFENTKFHIYSTGLKVKTHTHLEQLNRDQLKSLVPLSQDLVRNFTQGFESEFLIGLKKWMKELEELNLTHPDVIQLKNKIESQFLQIIVKPCGAMGADVITLLGDEKALLEFKKYNESKQSEYKLMWQADEKCLFDSWLYSENQIIEEMRVK